MLGFKPICQWSPGEEEGATPDETPIILWERDLHIVFHTRDVLFFFFEFLKFIFGCFCLFLNLIFSEV